MNIIAIVGCLCLLFAPEASSAKKQSDRKQAGLAGLVQVVREYRTFSKHELEPAEVSKLLKGRPEITITYNRKGDLLEEGDPDGVRATYSYSADGVRLKIVHGDTMPNSGNPIGPYVAGRDADKYDKSGRKIETVGYFGGDPAPWSRQKYEYSKQGHVQKLFHYWRDSELNLKLFNVVTYAYNSKGNEEEACWRDAAGEPMYSIFYSSYKYDAKGNWIERVESHSQVCGDHQAKERWATIYRIITYH